ncbi:MAG TPA: hypothetical protein VFT22_21105 [Kofleriaceae bacterium]|nr:hypothetical protein [Kofleriaceae bacterium]
MLAKGLPRIGARASVELVQITGGPVRIDDGSITGLYIVRDPEKLSRVERPTAMSR